jgi:hypothetical protein
MRSRKSLIKEADRVFSLYVRNRGARFGYNHCYTCSAYLPVEELQAGHFINRRFFNVRWHPLNVWPQCNTCNVEKHGNLVKFKAKLIAQYTEEAIDALYDLSHENNGGLDDYEIKEIIDKYKAYAL